MSDVKRATIRDRRQVTLPADVCRELDLDVGDSVTLELRDGSLVVTPSKKAALDALTAIQEAFQKSGITEEELQKTAREIRHRLVRERYGEPPGK